MTASYDLDTDVGRVRLRISDTDLAAVVFDDEELEAFLAMEGSVLLAAAAALEAIATNEALVLKVIRTLDLHTDGAKLADQLLKQATAFRKQAASTDAGEFEIAEHIWAL